MKIVEDYDGDPVNVIAPVAEGNVIALCGWTPSPGDEAPVKTLSIVGDLSSDERLLEIFKIFERDAESRKTRREGISEPNDKRWEPGFLLSFASSLLQLDDDWLDGNINGLFDRIVRHCFAYERYDIYSQPNELTLLAKHLMGEDVRKIYDPFAGGASFALAMPKGATYIGEEIQPLVAAIGNLRIMVNDVDGEVLVESSINDRDYDADIIVSTPPFGMPVETEPFSLGEKYGERNDACSFIMKKCLFSGKRGIVTVAGSFNLGSRHHECRKLLVDADFIDTVISFPPHVFDRTGVKTCLYVLNPYRTRKGKVRLVDAGDLYVSEERRNVLQVPGIVSLLNTPGPKNVEVDVDTVKANDYVLAPEFYMEPPVQVPDGASLMRLSRLLDPVPLKRISDGDFVVEGEFLNPKNDESANQIKIYRPGKDFIKGPLESRVNEIKRPCILINGLTFNFKAIVVEPEGKMLFASSNWRQFLLRDEDIVLPQYLVLQLHRPYFERQIQYSSLNVPVKILLNASIIVPSVEEQRREIESYQETLIGNLGLELLAEKEKKYDELAKEMRVRRHTLLNAMHGVVSGISVLKNYIDGKNGPFDKTDIVAPKKQMSMESLIERVSANLDRVVNLVTDFVNQDSYGPAEQINISDFCNEYRWRYVDCANFEIVWPDNNDVENNLVERERLNVSFSRKDLFTVFDNIVSNAVKHGFYGRDDENNVIRIEFEPVTDGESSFVSLRFLNNGIPLHSDITPSAIFEWGRKGARSSGTGVGGWHVRRIVEHYGGEVDVSNLEDDSGFTVMYEVRLPSKTTSQNNDYD